MMRAKILSTTFVLCLVLRCLANAEEFTSNAPDPYDMKLCLKAANQLLNEGEISIEERLHYLTCYKLVSKIQKAGEVVDPNVEFFESIILERMEMYTGFIEACTQGDKERVKTLLRSKKIDIHYKNREGEVPLILAVTSGSDEIVELLLQEKDKIDPHDKSRAFILAVTLGSDEIVSLLLQEKDKIDPHDKSRAFILAVTLGSDEIVSLLLQEKDKIDLYEKSRALILASEAQHFEMVKEIFLKESEKLSSYGYDEVSTINKAQEAVMDVAIDYGDKGFIRFLFRQDAIDKNELFVRIAQRERSNLPKIDLLQSLLKKGVDVNVKNANGDTALVWSAYRDQVDLVTFLIEKGADVNAKGTYGEDALIVASNSASLDLVKLLVGAGADINSRDSQGNTPLRAARDNNQQEIIDFLISKGALE
ncbi:MAG: ankyrin repeat domain-containing protein [Bdellovibrionales bacterium]|nr:ankyrin repeat domain-containing protein [Bdellovibrionales bacterium]